MVALWEKFEDTKESNKKLITFFSWLLPTTKNKMPSKKLIHINVIEICIICKKKNVHNNYFCEKCCKKSSNFKLEALATYLKDR